MIKVSGTNQPLMRIKAILKDLNLLDQNPDTTTSAEMEYFTKPLLQKAKTWGGLSLLEKSGPSFIHDTIISSFFEDTEPHSVFVVGENS